MKGLSIAGRKHFTPADLYETPAWATNALFKREKFIGTILEPACGYGAISDIAKEQGYSVISQDKYDYGYGQADKDFLKDYPEDVDNIITNPPYSFAKDFVIVSKLVATKKIAMFLKLNFLEGIGRYKLFSDTTFPLATVYVFCHRVNPFPHGTSPPQNSGTIAFAWFVWDKSHAGAPNIKWIDDKPTPKIS
jgi:hypothetical protein